MLGIDMCTPPWSREVRCPTATPVRHTPQRTGPQVCVPCTRWCTNADAACRSAGPAPLRGLVRAQCSEIQPSPGIKLGSTRFRGDSALHFTSNLHGITSGPPLTLTGW